MSERKSGRNMANSRKSEARLARLKPKWKRKISIQLNLDHLSRSEPSTIRKSIKLKKTLKITKTRSRNSRTTILTS